MTGTSEQGATGELPIGHAEDARGGVFFVEVGGERLAKLTYSRPAPGRVIVEHTEVSKRLGGRGVGRRLVVAAVDWSRAAGARITPTCPYARSVIEGDASLRDVLEPAR